MRAVCLLVALLSLCAVTSGANVYTITGRLGYPTTVNAHNGITFYQTWTLDATMIQPGTAVSLSITIAPQNTATTSTIAYTYNNIAGTMPSPTDTVLGAKKNTDLSNTFPIVVQANGTSVTSYVLNIAGVFSCGITCLGESNIVVSGNLLWNGVIQPFKAIQDPYTLSYSIAPLTFGVPAYVDLLTTTSIYVKLDMDTSSSLAGAKVVMVYQLATPPQTQADFTAATITYPQPGASQIAGTYDTGPISLPTQGRWFIAPWCATSGSSSSLNCNFDFAVGIGMEPAGAAGLLPSFFLVTLLSLLALVAL